MPKNLAIGIDVGGTKISITVGDRRGRLLAHRLIPTRTGTQTRKGIEEILGNLKELTSDKNFKNKILGIGIGIPGPVSDQKGTVPFSPHLQGWKGLPLKKIIQKSLRLPVRMANDANAAALGEKKFGQGRGLSHFVYITVSTGIGSGIVLDGKLLEGASFVAGEVGHMTIVPGGAFCKCGKQGCLEAYASGTALTRMARETLTRSQIREVIEASEISEGLSARVLGAAARKDHKAAIQLFDIAGGFLGIGIANLLNVINPQKVILGGGVLKSAPGNFWKSMMATCKEHAWPEAFKAVKIVPSRLHGKVGDLGALALVFDNS